MFRTSLTQRVSWRLEGAIQEAAENQARIWTRYQAAMQDESDWDLANLLWRDWLVAADHRSALQEKVFGIVQRLARLRRAAR